MNRKSKYIILSQFNAFISRAALSAVFLALTFYPLTAALAETSTSTSTATTTLPTLAESEAAVRSYFAGIPIMIPIAKCESGYRQYNSDGTPLRHLDYIGVFQIDENLHAKKALGLGWNIYTLDGNLAYAKYLYDQLGTRPWPTCSRLAAVSALPLTRNLKIGDENSQVKILQQLLNKAGFIIAKSGPGSAGQESTFFGFLTRAALKRFQCAKKIVCEGSEATTGYGQAGPRTRASLWQAGEAK